MTRPADYLCFGDPARPDPTRGWTRPVVNSVLDSQILVVVLVT